MEKLMIEVIKEIGKIAAKSAVAEVTKRLVKEAFELLSKRKTQEDE